jgi:plastocyanin
LVPGTVVIDAGGTVTFNVPRFSPHQVSIYGPGKRPEDVDATNLVAMPTGCPGGVARIADPDLLVQAYVQSCAPPAVPITHTFTTPGRYLVICSFNPHFQIGMYGWVIVRDR